MPWQNITDWVVYTTEIIVLLFYFQLWRLEVQSNDVSRAGSFWILSPRLAVNCLLPVSPPGCVISDFISSYKGSSCVDKGLCTWLHFILITTLKTLFPRKLTLWGTREVTPQHINLGADTMQHITLAFPPAPPRPEFTCVYPREFQKNIDFCFIDYAKAFNCVDHNKLWKILKEMGIPDHLTCLLRNLYAGQEATVRTGQEATDWFQRKGVRQGYILSPCLFNLDAEYIMRNAGLEEA